MNETFTPGAAAFFAGVDETTIRNWLRIGRIKKQPGAESRIIASSLVGCPIKRPCTQRDIDKFLRRKS